jgi:CheY-like chemotaxis protein
MARILVIDDNDLIRDFLKFALQEAGYDGEGQLADGPQFRRHGVPPWLASLGMIVDRREADRGVAS